MQTPSIIFSSGGQSASVPSGSNLQVTQSMLCQVAAGQGSGSIQLQAQPAPQPIVQPVVQPSFPQFGSPAVATPTKIRLPDTDIMKDFQSF